MYHSFLKSVTKFQYDQFPIASETTKAGIRIGTLKEYVRVSLLFDLSGNTQSSFKVNEYLTSDGRPTRLSKEQCF